MLYHLSYKGKNEVPPGLEPGLPASKAGVITNYTMGPVLGPGFEPGKHYAPELKSGPFDQLGNPSVLLEAL